MAEDYWGAGYWGDGYWGNGYWGQGGTSTGTQGGFRGYYHPPKPRLNPELLRLLKDWLEMKLNDGA